MNRTEIEYVRNPDGTPGFNWSVVTGCLHPCSKLYCYNTMKHTSPLNRFFKKNRGKETGKLHTATPQAGLYPYGFDPTYYPYRLEEPVSRKKPAAIFVADAADVFGKWVPDYIIGCILNVIKQCPQHTFILLTKNFGRLYEFEFPDNAWVGMTSEHGDKLCYDMQGIKAKTKFISFEPLHSGCGESGQTDGHGGVGLHGIDWIVIGAETGPRAERFRPKREWAVALVKSAHDQGIKVWMKDNLVPAVFQKSELVQELPGGLVDVSLVG